MMRTLAILGGTFDPIHFGHLRSALELRQLGIDEVRLMPCHVPAHRESPQCSAEQRLAMVKLAVQGETGLTVDARELEREGNTYTVDTLLALRSELGDAVSLSWVVGMDAFVGLNQWHEWETIPKLAHLIVMPRPGAEAPNSGEMARFFRARQAPDIDALRESASGRVLLQPLTQLDISATQIRSLVTAGQSPRYLLPDTVWDYIQEHQLYRASDRS